MREHTSTRPFGCQKATWARVASKQSLPVDFVIEFSMNAKRRDCDIRLRHTLFMGKRKGEPRQLRYRRFATAAEAIRFAVEELPAVRALGAWMQVGDQRFDGDDIQRLYETNDYPLQRRPSD